MASLFSDIVQQRPEEIENLTLDSLDWFRGNVRDIRRGPEKFMKENQNFVQRFELGKMYMFMYESPRVRINFLITITSLLLYVSKDTPQDLWV